MSEAFLKRLQQLYLQPAYTYSRGTKIDIGLKPDICLRHPDGRRWVFEMVHGNRKADHLLENHRRYREAGIQDTWILWHDLRPDIGAPLDPNQGVMLNLLPEHYLVKESDLNGSQRAILSMQPSGIRYLYAFSVSPLAPDLGVQFLDMMAIGVQVYAFRPLGQEGALSVTQCFIPMAELEFAEDGRLKHIENTPFQDQYFPEVLRAMGYASSQAVIPAEVLHRLADMMMDQGSAGPLVDLFIAHFLQQAPPEALEQIATYAKSGAIGSIQPYQSRLSAEDQRQLYNSPQAMQAMADEMQRAKEHMAASDLPPVLKQLLESVLGQSILGSSAEWMRWQAESKALRRVRENESKAL